MVLNFGNGTPFQDWSHIKPRRDGVVSSLGTSRHCQEEEESRHAQLCVMGREELPSESWGSCPLTPAMSKQADAQGHSDLCSPRRLTEATGVLKQGLENFFWKGPHTALLCCCHLKAATDKVGSSECGWVPVKLHLQKQAGAWLGSWAVVVKV